MVLGDGGKSVDIGQEDIDYGWVEMLPAPLADDVDALVEGKGILVMALADQGIKDIGQGHQAGGERNIVARQAAWITAPVPLFMVAAGNLAGDFEKAQRVAIVLGVLAVGMAAQYPLRWLRSAHRHRSGHGSA